MARRRRAAPRRRAPRRRPRIHPRSLRARGFRPRRRKTAAISTWGEKRNWSIGATVSMRNPPSTRIRASRAKVAALQETATTSGRALAANSRACASAPGARRIEQGGVERRQLLCAAAGGGTGRASRRRRPEACAVARGAALERGDRRGVGIGGEDLVSRARGGARRRPRRKRDRRPSSRLAAPLRRIAARLPRRPRSPAESRRAASATSASPKATRGGRRSITTAPWLETRARSSGSAVRMSFRVSDSSSGPQPRRSTSRPSSVAVTPMSSGLPRPRRSPASARAASNGARHRRARTAGRRRSRRSRASAPA